MIVTIFAGLVIAAIAIGLVVLVINHHNRPYMQAALGIFAIGRYKVANAIDPHLVWAVRIVTAHVGVSVILMSLVVAGLRGDFLEPVLIIAVLYTFIVGALIAALVSPFISITEWVGLIPLPMAKKTTGEVANFLRSLRNIHLAATLGLLTLAAFAALDKELGYGFVNDSTTLMYLSILVLITSVTTLAEKSIFTVVTWTTVASSAIVATVFAALFHHNPMWADKIRQTTTAPSVTYRKTVAATSMYKKVVGEGGIGFERTPTLLPSSTVCTIGRDEEKGAGIVMLYAYCPPTGNDPLHLLKNVKKEWWGYIPMGDTVPTDAPTTTLTTGNDVNTTNPQIINPTPCNPVFLHGDEEVHIPACHSGWVTLERVKQLTLTSSITPPAAWRGQRGSHDASLPVGKLLVEADGQMSTLEGAKQFTEGKTVHLMINSPTGQEPAGGREMFKIAVGR